MIYEYNSIKPKIGKNVFIAPTAVIIGDVTIGEGSSIWFGTVVRGDEASITIGKNTNIQDNCTIHVDIDKPAVIGDDVTVGHNAVVHGCIIEDRCLIGINAVVLNQAKIHTGSIVAAGAVVREKQVVGPNHLVTGAPAVLKKELGQDSLNNISAGAETYLRLAEEYRHIRAIS